MRLSKSAYIMRKMVMAAAAIFVFALCLTVSVYGEEVSGEIGGISKRSINIISERDLKTGIEYEMLFSIGDNIRYDHIKGLADLEVGDKINITYDEENETFGDMQRTKKKIRAISFISPAPPKVPDPDKEEYMLLKKGYKR